jgi:hypothetical protein
MLLIQLLCFTFSYYSFLATRTCLKSFGGLEPLTIRMVALFVVWPYLLNYLRCWLASYVCGMSFVSTPPFFSVCSAYGVVAWLSLFPFASPSLSLFWIKKKVKISLIFTLKCRLLLIINQQASLANYYNNTEETKIRNIFFSRWDLWFN